MASGIMFYDEMPFTIHIGFSLYVFLGYSNVRMELPNRSDMYSNMDRTIWTRTLKAMGISSFLIKLPHNTRKMASPGLYWHFNIVKTELAACYSQCIKNIK